MTPSRYKPGDRVRIFPYGETWGHIIFKQHNENVVSYPDEQINHLVLWESGFLGEMSDLQLISEEESLVCDEATIWTWHQPNWYNTVKPRPKIVGDAPYQFTGKITDDPFQRDKFTITNRELNGYYDHMRWGEDAFHTREEAIAHEYESILNNYYYQMKVRHDFEQKYALDKLPKLT